MRKNAFFLTLQFLFDLVLLTAFFLPDFTFSLSFQRLIFLIFLSGCFHLSIPLTLLLSPDIIHCLEHQLDSLSLSLSLPLCRSLAVMPYLQPSNPLGLLES